MDSEANKALVRRLHEDIWSEDDLDAVDEIIAPDYVAHCQSYAEEIRGPDGMRAFHRDTKETFPDWKETIEFLICEGDMVAGFARARATMKGPIGSFPATNGLMTLDFPFVHRLEGGKLAETWLVWDNVAMLARLGLWPPPAGVE